MKILSAILILFGLDKLAIILSLDEEDIPRLEGDFILSPKIVLVLLGIESLIEIFCGLHIFFL